MGLVQGRDVRVAYIGEEDLYDFMRTWLGSTRLSSVQRLHLQLDWTKAYAW